MPTITRAAIQWMQDELEAKEAQIDELEIELEASMDENQALRLRIQQLMTDRSLVV